MTDPRKPDYTNGIWVWDDAFNGLAFRSKKEPIQARQSTPLAAVATSSGFGGIRFKDAIDNLAQAKFKRYFQRRISPADPKVVTIQDVKDVALFTADPSDLTPEFIHYVHTEKMDALIRSLIIYFEYYIQVWEYILARRKEAARKLRLPITTDLENDIRDNLTDLRSMVARNYGHVIMGLGDSKKFYHMSSSNNLSLSDKDRHLFECLLSLLMKIIWIALLRKNLSLIERELNRLFRTLHFYTFQEDVGHMKTSPEENRILLGATYFVEKKLKSRSSMVQELVLGNQCYRMLAIGHLRLEPYDKRLTYLEAAYTAPEELLVDLNVGVGILGLPRSDFDAVLIPKETVTKKVRMVGFKLPPKEDYSLTHLGSLTQTPPTYSESPLTLKSRNIQCSMWRTFLLTRDRKRVVSLDSGATGATS